MVNSLIPELNGRRLTVDVALKFPSVIRDRVAALADDQLLLPRFFSPYGARIEGGGLLYASARVADLYVAGDVEKRSPGSEYKVVEGVDPEVKLAPVEDYGGKFKLTDEEIVRNTVSKLDQYTTQLANTITKKLNARAVAEIEANLAPENVLVGHPWATVALDGASPTAATERPTADLAEAQAAADRQEMGVTHDLLILGPDLAATLRTLYGADLKDVLESFGLKLFVSPRVADGVAYVLAEGQAGSVGFEKPLTIDVWDDRSVRSQWVQGYAVPAIAVERPYSVKKLVGLAN
ncbi:hypothetical protein CH282_26185 [Rhodococcus sp. 06-418-1B]|nr:major capsid protein [Rhodococcus sp. 06-418-1B]OZC76369.1 hypothetical protein CH282_26185 [Rhodococcus sp. 06-418-1B]